MPTAAPRPCLQPGCRTPVVAGRGASGRCPAHQQQTDQTRRRARILTYAEPWWLAFRQAYRLTLIVLGIPPVCGAQLPEGPTLNRSQCLQAGLHTGLSSTGTDLHFHHEPPLTEAEQRAAQEGDHGLVCNARRIVLLCDRCHATETDRDRRWPAA